MDIESLKPLLSLLLWGLLFFFMMRFGCGAHIAGGHGHHGRHGGTEGERLEKDPVCGMEVARETAKAATVHKARTFYFCSASCRDKFEADPEKYASGPAREEHHHG